ncbi:hypothetical protein POM88_000452 [Heracleum sosnowskyi]|uniref:Uncharacterized protein n=1 Tax=Heracleum sosnowskyi TaxID=360622 RepID=A0AAD8N9F2_9APIA|nr:hypothetical protein POM88_000452 [Heracleum sosnowskyi]
MDSRILANTTKPGSTSMGSAAGSLIRGNHQQLITPLFGQGASSPSLFTSLLSGNHQQLLTPLPVQGASSAYSFISLLSGQSIGSGFLRGSSLSGGMKFNSYGGVFGDGTSGGVGVRGGTSTLQQYGSYGSGGKYGGCREYLSDQMNAPYGGMKYNVNNADGMLVGEVNKNVWWSHRRMFRVSTVISLSEISLAWEMG